MSNGCKMCDNLFGEEHIVYQYYGTDRICLMFKSYGRLELSINDKIISSNVIDRCPCCGRDL